MSMDKIAATLEDIRYAAMEKNEAMGHVNPRYKKVRTPRQVERDRLLIAPKYLRGWTHRAITEWLNANLDDEGNERDSDRDYTLSREQVSQDIYKMRSEWRDEQVRGIRASTDEMLAKLDELERTYWQHYEGNKDIKALNGVANVISQKSELLGIRRPEMNTQKPNVQVVFAWQVADKAPQAVITEGDDADDDDTIEGEYAPAQLNPPKE